MSERITSSNLDEVIAKNRIIEKNIREKVAVIWSNYNSLKINSPVQLSFHILREYGLIQLPIDNPYLSGAILIRDEKRIPFINTTLIRANQYFTAWHEIYHLLFDNVSFDHVIASEVVIEERKAEYFASLMLLGNLMPYFNELDNLDFQSKIFQCMNAFQVPYKAVLISLYDSALKESNAVIARKVKENFDLHISDMADKFRNLGLDDSLVLPSYIVNVSFLQNKISTAIVSEPEIEYHKDNEKFLKSILEKFKILTGDLNA